MISMQPIKKIAGNRRPEIGNRKPEIGNRNVGYWMFVTPGFCECAKQNLMVERIPT